MRFPDGLQVGPALGGLPWWPRHREVWQRHLPRTSVPAWRASRHAVETIMAATNSRGLRLGATWWQKISAPSAESGQLIFDCI